MAKVHLVIGPVGSGKSTFALQLCENHQAIRFTLDDWMANLFSEDRPEYDVMDWYIERTQRCIELIWVLAQQLNSVGTNVVLEIGLIRRNERNEFYKRLQSNNIDHTIYILDAPREVRRKRVEQRNLERGKTYSMFVPPDIFELANNMWEPPSELEYSDRDVRFISTDSK